MNIFNVEVKCIFKTRDTCLFSLFVLSEDEEYPNPNQGNNSDSFTLVWLLNSGETGAPGDQVGAQWAELRY